MGKRIVAHFYNINYSRYEPLNRLSPNTMVTGEILPYPSDKEKKEIEDAFPDVEILEDNSSYNIIFPTGRKVELFQFVRKLGLNFIPPKYWMVIHSNPEGYLFSGWGTGYKTKILPEDLPESYIRCNNYKKNGYLQTAGVKDLLYRPSPFHNHTFKDDFLFLSYSGNIKWEGTWDKSVYDEYIFGNDIIDVIVGLEKNSPELKDKINRIKEKMVKQYNLYCDEMNRRESILPHEKIENFEELYRS